MKSIEQLKRLEKIPNYTLTDEEKQYLQGQRYTGLPEDPSELETSVSSETDTTKKKQQPNVQVTGEGVAAKDVGKVEKHPSDPVAE